MRALLIAVAVFLLVVGGVNAMLGRVGPSHFLPEQRMRSAVAAERGCTVLFGDSRMEAAFDEAAFHEALRARGADRCVINLATSYTDISSHFLTYREYRRRGGRASMLVIGKVADSLLGREGGFDPKDMVGNNALHLRWSRPGDVFYEQPGFPTSDIGTLDAGLRFLVARASALGHFQSIFWFKVQVIQNALVAPPQAQTRWGALSFMRDLQQEFRVGAAKRLAAVMEGPPEQRLSRWFPRMVDILAEDHIPLVLVEVPMPSEFRHVIDGLPAAAAYQRWLAQQLPALGGKALIDLSRQTWLEDGKFEDPLHLAPAGAKLFSRDLADKMADLSL
jgi:hypothetical protein